MEKIRQVNELEGGVENEFQGKTREELAGFGKGVLEVEENVESDLGFWCGEYRDIESQFVKYRKEHGEDEGYLESLAKYEADLGDIWKRVDEVTKKEMTDGRMMDRYEMAEEQDIALVDPRESIEGAIGVFYDERAKGLFEKIAENENEGEKVDDRGILRQTWSKVLHYIEATHDYELLREDYNNYQEARRATHNAMIKQLNDINGLAEKYGSKRFTVRNFMTNDFRYERSRDLRGKLDARAEYDRESVAAYFRNAFARDFRDSEIKSKNKDI